MTFATGQIRVKFRYFSCRNGGGTMCAEARKEPEDSRPMYSIGFNSLHLGTTISNSLEGFEFVTEKTTRNLREGFKSLIDITTNNLREGSNSVTENLLKLSEAKHAPFENFLKTWYYIPITVWWKTFAPPMFNSVSTFAREAKKWTANPLGLSACGPFLAMLGTFAHDVKKQADDYNNIVCNLQKLLGTLADKLADKR